MITTVTVSVTDGLVKWTPVPRSFLKTAADYICMLRWAYWSPVLLYNEPYDQVLFHTGDPVRGVLQHRVTHYGRVSVVI